MNSVQNRPRQTASLVCGAILLILMGSLLLRNILKRNLLNVQLLQLVTVHEMLADHPLYGNFGLTTSPFLVSTAEQLASSYDAADNDSFSALRSKGLALLIAGLNREAAQILDEAHSARPADYSVALQRAEAHARAGNKRLAREIWREFRVHDSFMRAASTTADLDDEEREHYYRLAIAIAPEEPEAYRRWMRAAYDHEDWITISEIWSIAEANGLRDDNVYFFAAHAYQKLGQVGVARALLLEALALPDVQVDTMLSLVRLYWDTGEQEAADELLAQIKQRFPDLGYPYFVHGNHLLRHGQYQTALPLLEEAVTHGYENALVWERLAIAQYHVQQYEAAAFAIQNALDLHAEQEEQENPEAQVREVRLLAYMGATLWNLGRTIEAESYACQAVQRAGFPEELPPLPNELINLCKVNS